MAVVLVFQGPTLTEQAYSDVVRRLTSGHRERMESRSDWPVEGILAHVAGEGPNGFRIVDVWESAEAAQQFGELLGPHMREVGITEQPEIYPAHAFVSI